MAVNTIDKLKFFFYHFAYIAYISPMCLEAHRRTPNSVLQQKLVNLIPTKNISDRLKDVHFVGSKTDYSH